MTQRSQFGLSGILFPVPFPQLVSRSQTLVPRHRSFLLRSSSKPNLCSFSDSPGLGHLSIVSFQAFRPQTVYVSQLFLQTFAYILGRVLETFLPGPHQSPAKFLNFFTLRTADTPFWRFINPGVFNIKEHVGILIMSAAATHGALAINIFAADDLFYGIYPNPAIAIFTLLGSQLMGYGIAGTSSARWDFDTN